MQIPRKILIQRADKLGDITFSLPVIERIKKHWPHVSIHVLTSSIGKEFLESHPLIDKIWVIDVFKKPFLYSYFTLIKQLKKQGFTLYLSLWNQPYLAWLGVLARIPLRIGDSSNIFQRFAYTLPVFQTWDDQTRHQVEFNLNLLAPLELNDNDLIKRIYTNHDTDKDIKTTFRRFLNPERKHILIICGTGGSNRPIPEKAVLDFIERIQKINEFNIILEGRLDEQAPLTGLRGDHLLNNINKTSISEMLSEIKLCDYVIGPDTGPIHIAAFMDKPILFFSYSKAFKPAGWGPYSPFFNIIREEYHCAHLDPKQCSDDTCLAFLTGSYLYERFCELVNMVNVDDKMSLKEQRKQRLLQSFRILYCFHSQDDLEEAQEGIRLLQDQGLSILPYSCKRFSLFDYMAMRHVLIKRNINIIQGKVPVLFRWLIRFYMAVLKQYVSPIFITLSIHEYISLDDFIRFYRLKWKHQARQYRKKQIY
ncbi:glycosyltransferase family 9 protein [Thermoproteota archaeon]